MRKAAKESAELALPQYKTSLTPPSWPVEGVPDSAADRKLARADTAMEDVARREQILAVQVKAHRHCVAELAEERALFEAERINHAKKVKAAEEALLRMREQLENAALAAKDNSAVAAANQDAPLAVENARRDAEKVTPADNSERATVAVPEAGPLLSQLARQAADFAALAQTVADLQAQLNEEQARHSQQADELRAREEALAQRESEADRRISTVTLQLHADRESLAREQEEFAAARQEAAEWRLKLEATENDLAQRERALALGTQKLHEDEAHLSSKRNAIAAVEEGHRQRENDLLQVEQEVHNRAAELARREAEVAQAEAEVHAATCDATAREEAAERSNAELNAGWEKLRSESEAMALVRKEQADLSAALEQRSEEVARREATIEHVVREANEVRQQAVELRKERQALETKLAELQAREAALAKERVAFEERRRKFRESLTSVMEC